MIENQLTETQKRIAYLIESSALVHVWVPRRVVTNEPACARIDAAVGRAWEGRVVDSLNAGLCWEGDVVVELRPFKPPLPTTKWVTKGADLIALGVFDGERAVILHGVRYVFFPNPENPE